jgi:hypothetical protein
MNRTFRSFVLCVLGMLWLFPLTAMSAADPYQRYITFKNDSKFTVWPVYSAPAKDNGGGKDGVFRIMVNANSESSGIPAGGSVRLYIPKTQNNTGHSWYLASRVLVFTVDPQKYGQKVLALSNGNIKNALTDKSGDKALDNLCPDGVCWNGWAPDNYPLDAPNQLLEATFMSKDWTGKAVFPDGPDKGKPSGTWDDPDDTRGDPFIDIDLSYVDEVYLPIAITLDDHGSTAYMGTAADSGRFFSNALDFIKDPKANWQSYALYDPIVPEKNSSIYKEIQNNSGNFPSLSTAPRVPSGYNMTHYILSQGTSPSYTMFENGPRETAFNLQCKEWDKVGEKQSCPNGNGAMLGCCNALNYMISNTMGAYASERNNEAKHIPGRITTNPSFQPFYDRWKVWVEGNPCSNIGNIKYWPSDAMSGQEKQAFCSAFYDTVNFVWKKTVNDPDAIKECSIEKDPARGYPIGTQEYNACMVGVVTGYKVGPQGGKQPESVQALMRNVPWVEPKGGKNVYQWDKFIHFWAPVDSEFNLNPYVTLVKRPLDKKGLAGMSAYSFSIDDLWGNYQDAGTGVIVDIGGTSALANTDNFDPYTKFKVSVGPGWDHIKFCNGKTVSKLTETNKDGLKIGKPAFFAFWGDRVGDKPNKLATCEVAIYPHASEDVVFKYRLEEYTAQVTDNITHLQQKVRGMRVAEDDAKYCEEKSSADLADICDPRKTLLLPEVPADDGGGLENVYVSVDPNSRPAVTLSVPPPPGYKP